MKQLSSIYKGKKLNNNLGSDYMNKLYLSLFLIVIVVLPLISAEQQSLGTFKQNDCINLIQTCANCTYVNISSIVTPNSNGVQINSAMSQQGTIYNYTFCSTDQIGKYIVNGVGDLDGVNTVWNYDLEITPSGFTDTLGFYIVLLIALALVITLGFSIKEGWFVVIGGMGLIILGLYSVINGIAGFKDMFMTWAISLFLIGVGTFLSIKSTLEMMDVELS
jgi:hypothetical protein